MWGNPGGFPYCIPIRTRPYLYGIPILRTTLQPVAAGALMGVIVATIVARLVAHLLLGVSAFDPIAVAASIAVLSLATMLACYAPLRRALGIGPMTALRCD